MLRKVGEHAPKYAAIGYSISSHSCGGSATVPTRGYMVLPMWRRRRRISRIRTRLREVTQAVLTHHGKDIVAVMGSPIDAHKLRSLMTLFDAVSPNDIFRDVLNAFYDAKEDKRSLSAIRKMER